MKIQSIDDVVAKRKYTLATPTGSSEIDLTIGKPFPSPEVQDGTEYICPFSISHDKSTRFQFAAGIDSLQSLLLALSAVKAEVGRMAKGYHASLNWFAGEPGEIDIHLQESN